MPSDNNEKRSLLKKEIPLCKQHSGNVAICNHIVSSENPFATTLLISDLHLESGKFNRKYFDIIMRRARENNCRVRIIGDVFDLMQGRHDKRGSKHDENGLVKKWKTEYSNAVVKEGEDVLGPYADLIDLITYGNHETKYMLNNEHDVLKNMVEFLNIRFKSNILLGAYHGWCKERFLWHHNGNFLASNTINMKYYHSRGSYSRMTKGINGHVFMSADYPDADIIVTGDNHSLLIHDYPQERITEKGEVYFRKQYHIGLPSFKEDYSKSGFGWAVEKHLGPRTLGGVFVKYRCIKSNGFEIDYEVTPITAV